ncbi:thiol-disulfide isomerase [Serratia liquefaciens]|uniref:conjugal transfer protein TraF n=1 Tax=Serratia liquefaciens TaxID=614 RepID=UPI0010225411|nr:conjugal transfer protein TraF [Serratia liquefaciens]RYM64477.1 thiol-disulfide isomerase [Serratia liquefaciens]
MWNRTAPLAGALLSCAYFMLVAGALTLLPLVSALAGSPATTTPNVQQREPSAAPTSSPVWFRLADGRTIDIQHWQVVHFIRSDCPYCHRFNPVLRDMADRLGLKVFVYSFDGVGDAVFPDVLPTNDAVLEQFFAELPKVTPTDFLVNTQTLVTIPLAQGALTEVALSQRLDESFGLAVRLGVL